MTELLVELLPFLAAFYVVGGVAVVRPFQRVFTSALGRTFDVHRPGLTFLGLAPWSEVVSAQSFPLAVAEDAVYRLAAADRPVEPAVLGEEDLERVDLEGLPPAEAGQVWFAPWVVAGKVALARAASPRLAARFAAQLAAIQAAGAGARVEKARALLLEAPGAADLRELRARVRWHALALRVLCTLLFAVLFGLLPLIVYLPELAPMKLERALRLWLLLDGWVLLMAGMTLARAGVPAGAIAGVVFQLLLFPPMAARALSAVTREIYERFDPSAVASALLGEHARATYARREIRKLEYTAARTEALGLAGYWKAWRKVWDRALKDVKSSSQEALRPPARIAPEATRYCPVCSSEYRTGDACSDCGVPLVKLEDAA